MPQSSMSRWVVPRPVIASTMSSVSSPVARTSFAMPCTSCRAPVELSVACTNTARTSGATRARISSSEKVVPYGALSTSTLQPKALARPVQRSPNFPAVRTRILPPGEVRLETEASITPVPEQASTRTSLRVPMNSFMSASTRWKSVRKSAVRWCAVKEAIAVCAAGSSGVGPGVNRRFLRSIVRSL